MSCNVNIFDKSNNMCFFSIYDIYNSSFDCEFCDFYCKII